MKLTLHTVGIWLPDLCIDFFCFTTQRLIGCHLSHHLLLLISSLPRKLYLCVCLLLPRNLSQKVFHWVNQQSRRPKPEETIISSNYQSYLRRRLYCVLVYWFRLHLSQSPEYMSLTFSSHFTLILNLIFGSEGRVFTEEMNHKPCGAGEALKKKALWLFARNSLCITKC